MKFVAGDVLLDTSADSELARLAPKIDWPADTAGLRLVVSVFTVVERLRGYNLALRFLDPARRNQVRQRKSEYSLALAGGRIRVLPFTSPAALYAAEIMARAPHPPSPRKRSHRLVESHPDRLSRWRFDAMIAATALTFHLRLAHNNARDFDAIRAVVDAAPGYFPGSLELIHIDELTS